MNTATRRALAIAGALGIVLFTGSARADYGAVSTWPAPYKALVQPTELAGSGEDLLGNSYALEVPDDFVFRFYGEDIRSLAAHGVGAISFGDEFISRENQYLPYDGSPAGIIAPWWDEWNRVGADPFDGGIAYAISGEPGHQVLAIQWTNLQYLYCETFPGESYSCDHMKHFSFQVRIYEPEGAGDSLIQFRYAPVLGAEDGYGLDYYETLFGWDWDPYVDLSGTVGVEDRAREQGTNALPCEATCRQSDWPAEKVILLGRPEAAELLADLDVADLSDDGVTARLATTTTVRNIGLTAASGIEFAYYLSANETLDVQKDLLLASHAPFDLEGTGKRSFDDTFVADPAPAPGWYHVCLRVDSGEVAAEPFEDNNDACSSQRYLVGRDFAAAIAAPDTAGPGDEVEVSLTVTNLSHVLASPAYRVLLSADAKVSGDDIELARDQLLELPPGASFNGSPRLLIPADALTSHENDVARYLLLQIDPDGEIAEADETNNVAVSDPVRLVKADLRVTAASLELPDGCFFGRPVTLTMTVANDGAARARGFTDALLMSDNGVITSYDLVVASTPAFCRADEDCAGTLGDAAYCLPAEGSCSRDCAETIDCRTPLGEDTGLTCVAGQCRTALAGYDRTTVTLTGELPRTDASGAPLKDATWYFGAVADLYDVIAEGGEGNNARPAATLECHAPAPDFVATALLVPGDGAAGEQLAVHRTLRNSGNLAGTVTWSYYLSSNEIVSRKDIELEFVDAAAGSSTLEPGQVDDDTDVLSLPSSLAPGSYHLGVFLDPDGVVPEIHDDNNERTAATTIGVQGAALRVGTSALPPATLEVPYQRQLVATGGAGAYAWKVGALPLPPGLRLGADGSITGKPTEPGDFVFAVEVKSGGATAQALLFLAVLPATGPLVVSTGWLPPAYVDVLYRVELAAVGGIPPYTWSIIGRPPAGLSLKNDTITGKPEIADGGGPTTFQIEVRDSRGTTTRRELGIAVLSAADLSVQTTRIQDGLVGQPYQQIVRGAGGEPPYEFTIEGLQGSGLTANSAGPTTSLIAGVPTQAGIYEVKVAIADQTGQHAFQTFKFAVNGQLLRVQDRSLPATKPGEVYPETQLVAASSNVRFEIYVGDLPSGVSLSAVGLLAGTVEASAAPRDYTFLVRVSDDQGGEGFGSFTIVVQAPKIKPSYRETRSGCSAGGPDASLLLPLLGAVLLLRRRP